MFEAILDTAVGLTDAELTEALRADELAARTAAADRAALIAVRVTERMQGRSDVPLRASLLVPRRRRSGRPVGLLEPQ